MARNIRTLLKTFIVILSVFPLTVNASSQLSRSTGSVDAPESNNRIQQQFAIEPTDRTAIVGDTVVLACRVTNKAGNLQWTKDGFGLGADRNLTGFPRYTMVGSDDEGDFSLNISPVTLEDDGVFQCQVGAAEGVKGIRSRSAQFTVFAPPNPPRILQGRTLKTTVGQTTGLVCEAEDGKPAAELTWLDGEGNVIRKDVEYRKFPQKDSKRENARLTWNFTASRKYDGQTFTCRTENPALKQPLITTIDIVVNFPPEVNLTVSSKDLHEGDSLLLICSHESNPSDVTIQWYKDDEPLRTEENNQATYKLERLTRKLNGDTISCEVKNSVGTTRASHTLNISYKPQFKPHDPVITTTLGTEVAVNCEVDSNPKPEITWTRQGSSIVLGRQQIYVIREMTSLDEGTYICKASAPGFQDITSEYHVLLKGPPKVVSSSIQYASEGREGHIECLVESVPPATRVQWFKDGMLVDTENIQGYHVVRESRPTGERNRLVISEISANDFGEYNCTVWNPLGESSMMITLSRDSRVDSTILMAAATAGAVSIVLLLMTLLVCFRKRSLPQVDFKDSVNKPLPNGTFVGDTNSSGGESDIKVEIVTASSLSNTENNSPQHLLTMDNSWDSGHLGTTITDHQSVCLPAYKMDPSSNYDITYSTGHQVSSGPLKNAANISDNPESIQTSQNCNPAYVGSGSDYMSTNSDYGVMLPLSSLQLSLQSGHHPHTSHPPALMTNNSLYSSGSLNNASLVLPAEYESPSHSIRGQPIVSLPLTSMECATLQRPMSQLRMATAQPQTAYISSTLPYRKSQMAPQPPLHILQTGPSGQNLNADNVAQGSPVASRRYITATPNGRTGPQFKTAQLATHV